MFERFTERARQVVVLAQEEARRLKHNYIGTEHILLGLLREGEGLGARVLDSLDITVGRVRAEVVRMADSGEDVPSGSIPFTPRSKRVLELALREAQGLGHDKISTEHILLGLVRENEGVATRILLDLGADSEEIRTRINRMLPGAPAESASSQATISTPVLPQFADPPLPTPPDLELGWRGRPIALAALGAAVLARMTFDLSKTGLLEPLEMQVLVRLILGPPDATLAEPGELFGSLAGSLACDHDDLRDAVRTLTKQQLVNCSEEQDGDQRISITMAGSSAFERWLAQTAPVFGRWPGDQPAADDAIG